MIDPLNFFKALGVGIVILVMIGWVGWLISRVLAVISKKLKYAFMKWKESDVEWCMDAIEKEYTLEEIAKELLLTDTPKKRVEDMIYLFTKCEKKMKGGKLQDE